MAERPILDFEDTGEGQGSTHQLSNAAFLEAYDAMEVTRDQRAPFDSRRKTAGAEPGFLPQLELAGLSEPASSGDVPTPHSLLIAQADPTDTPERQEKPEAPDRPEPQQEVGDKAETQPEQLLRHAEESELKAIRAIKEGKWDEAAQNLKDARQKFNQYFNENPPLNEQDRRERQRKIDELNNLQMAINQKNGANVFESSYRPYKQPVEKVPTTEDLQAFQRFEQTANDLVGQGNGQAMQSDWSGAYASYRQAVEDYKKAWDKVPATDEQEQRRRERIKQELNAALRNCAVNGRFNPLPAPPDWDAPPSGN